MSSSTIFGFFVVLAEDIIPHAQPYAQYNGCCRRLPCCGSSWFRGPRARHVLRQLGLHPNVFERTRHHTTHRNHPSFSPPITFYRHAHSGSSSSTVCDVATSGRGRYHLSRSRRLDDPQPTQRVRGGRRRGHGWRRHGWPCSFFPRPIPFRSAARENSRRSRRQRAHLR